MSKSHADMHHDTQAAEQAAFRARMEAQCREIRRYRLRVLKSEFRWLSLEAAAKEWVALHAKEYAERENRPNA